VSIAMTRVLVRTPITPNQVSCVTAILVVLGCWLTAHAGMRYAIAGTAVMLGAAYVDCCDGEIARLKLLSSRSAPGSTPSSTSCRRSPT
jgi:phosphatidylglycerophosphate synthase